MNKNTIIGIIAAVVIIALVIILSVTGTSKKSTTLPWPETATDQTTAQGSTAETSANTPKIKGDIQEITKNQQVNESSDLITFSVAAGQTILGNKSATGTIDSGYIVNGKLPVVLADHEYKTMKTIYGTVTGKNAAGNTNFSLSISTTGIVKGAGYIIFNSGAKRVVIPVIYE